MWGEGEGESQGEEERLMKSKWRKKEGKGEPHVSDREDESNRITGGRGGERPHAFIYETQEVIRRKGWEGGEEEGSCHGDKEPA